MPAEKQFPITGKPPGKALSKWWRVALALSPVLFLGLTEGVLRLARVGYPTTFFIARDGDVG
jgi:hypothetical protein